MIIIYILIALVVAAVIAFVAGSLRNRSLKKKLAQGEISEMPTVVQPPQECCGQHEVCEKESLLPRTIPAYSIKVKKSRMLWPYCPKSIR